METWSLLARWDTSILYKTRLKHLNYKTVRKSVRIQQILNKIRKNEKISKCSTIILSESEGQAKHGPRSKFWMMLHWLLVHLVWTLSYPVKVQLQTIAVDQNQHQYLTADSKEASKIKTLRWVQNFHFKCRFFIKNLTKNSAPASITRSFETNIWKSTSIQS